MTISITGLLSPMDPNAVLADVEGFLGVIFRQPLELQPGSPVAAMLSVFVNWSVNSVWNPLILPVLQSLFLDYASGDALHLIADDDYNRPFIQQSAGTALVTLQSTGSFSGVIAPGGARFANTATGFTYTNTTAITIPLFASGPPTTGAGTFQADVAGSAASCQIGQVPSASVPLVKGPIGVTVQSMAGALLGTDDETDANLIIRLRAVPAQLAPVPPKSAYEAVARDPIGSLTRAGVAIPSEWNPAAPAITRVRVSCPGAGLINVYLASASGPAAGDSSTDGSDVYKAWFAIANLVVSYGLVTLTVQAATPATITIGTITLYLDPAANVSAAQAIATATTAFNSFFSVLPIGGELKMPGGQGAVFYNALVAALGAGPGVIDVTISSFTSDFVFTQPYFLAVPSTPTFAAVLVAQS